jgi:hypothetical protein
MSEKSISTKADVKPSKPAVGKSEVIKTPAAKPAQIKSQPTIPAKKNKKAKKSSKEKVVRDSFTMPQNDYIKISELKQVCLKAGLQVKKSELLRAGLHALGKLSIAQLKQTIMQMEQIKTGRPKKD